MTNYHAVYYSYDLTRRSASDDIAKLGPSLVNATVDLNPHQLDAALFAFRSPLSRGAILADEVGLGKTIEAGLVISQLWAERKRRILVIAPTILRKQWAQELADKFFISSLVLDTREFNSLNKSGNAPFATQDQVVICSYHFARTRSAQIRAMHWDLIIIDEAHRLRNVYKPSNKIANAIKDAVNRNPLLLLTATPLQNSLLELYGLISFLDEHLFGDIETFKTRYMRGPIEQRQLDELKQRLRPICQRTLRRQVTEYVRFTNRIPITQDFTPTNAEQELYDKVTAYLQRETLNALPASQRKLLTLVLRKLLASSTFAIAGTFDSLVDRLKSMGDESGEGIEKIEADFESFGEMEDEWADGGEASDAPTSSAASASIQAEIDELTAYGDLATSITFNAKGEALLNALKHGFEKLAELGASRKAIIFTESRRTQAYLWELLNSNGFADRVLTINGTNTDDRAGKIYKAWFQRHQGEPIVTGNKTVDLRAALVEHFRDHADILIATEAAAEGVNLQFCSLVVNYDLPWNPQRIEQRIGRCHRYGQAHDVVVINFLNRANAGIRAINELKPILGLELTATPQIEAGTTVQPFKNVIYSYPLYRAMEDGFVKEPAVATRENFNLAHYTEEQLERLKLEDGIRIHESTKTDLEVYAKQYDRPLVKPFMLVVAQDTDHANSLVSIIKGDDFFEGRYKDRVITVHSNQRGEERDDVVEKLVAVENPDEPTEIVVHVNMLKEGWDVTNLYTIVPLRAANSRTLVEQSIGRGLRLPYGKRTGVSAVDRLTIVAHDRFQAIIDDANNPNSIIRTGVVIGRDVPQTPTERVVVPPRMEAAVASPTGAVVQEQLIFPTPAERAVAQTTLDVVRRFERLPTSANLRVPEIQAQIVREVRAAYMPIQGELEGIVEQPDVEAVVARTIELFIENSIDIPRVIVVPTGEISSGFRDFDLDLNGIRLQPVAEDILIQHLRTNRRERLVSGDGVVEEERPENYLVRTLMDFDDVSYDDHADLLYKLAGQVVAHLHSYLPDQAAVRNVLQYHQRRLGELIHAQMQTHRWEQATSYETTVSKGFVTLRPNNYSATVGEGVRDFRAPVEERQYIRGMLFGGFRRCLYPIQKFQSDPERRFAVLLEDEEDVLKWFKPAPGQFQIYYQNDQNYEPDFLVETKTAKFLCEPKRASELNDEIVQAKARAAVAWCERATAHELANSGKPWSYLLIPHDDITANRTLQGLIATYTKL